MSLARLAGYISYYIIRPPSLQGGCVCVIFLLRRDITHVGRTLEVCPNQNSLISFYVLVSWVNMTGG